MDAKAYLLRLRKLEKTIENKWAEYRYWLGVARSATANVETVHIKDKNGKPVVHGVEKVQSSGNKQKMASAVERYIGIKDEEIPECIRQLEKERREIIAVLEQLDATPYDILYKMYVGVVKEDGTRQYMELQDIANLYGKSYSWANQQHLKAVALLQAIIEKY